uniref:Germin-like protein n=1 Tax=Cannabis sativa TaxID=3483 RepID=A0A803P612_CANSA
MTQIKSSSSSTQAMYQNLITIWFLVIIFSFQCTITLASDPDPVQDYCIPNPKFGAIKTISHLMILPCKNSTEATTDDFVFSGMKLSGNFTDTGLATISVNPTIFPGLNTLGMSFARADLKVGGINPPHFHPRATEIVYIVQGSVYSGFVDSTNRVFARILEQGEVMVYPRGLVHFQMNVGKKPATIFGSFNSQSPGLQKIPAAVFGSGINEELLEKAFGLSPKQIGKMRRKFNPEMSN